MNAHLLAVKAFECEIEISFQNQPLINKRPPAPRKNRKFQNQPKRPPGRLPKNKQKSNLFTQSIKSGWA
jgi:hypothetical protein